MADAWYAPHNPQTVLTIDAHPWLHPRAIAYLESLLNPEMDVLEHGSGGSTLWMASRVKSVMAIERDDDWNRTLKRVAPENVKVLSSLANSNAEMNYFDLVFIDGEPVEDRAKWIKAAPALLKEHGFIVLDNANRPEYAKEREALRTIAKELYICNGNEGHTKYLVTEFYQL